MRVRVREFRVSKAEIFADFADRTFREKLIDDITKIPKLKNSAVADSFKVHRDYRAISAKPRT